MPNYNLTPAGSSTPIVRLYQESLRAIPRRQTQQAERHAVVEGGEPASGSEGLEPGEIRFEGYWLGAEAADIADEFRQSFVDEPSVERIDVQAIDDSGSFVASRYNGRYRIADETRVDQPVAQSTNIWQYSITLIED